MPSTAEIKTQVAHELEMRKRLAVPVMAGGVLYLIGAIILVSTSNSAPTVGVLQGLTPAISGVAQPAVSPRAAELKYTSHHAFALIAGSVLTAMALLVLTYLLLFLIDAVRFRRPQSFGAARTLVLVGGPALALVTVVREVALAIATHKFAVGHDLSNASVEKTVTKGTLVVVVGTLGPVAWLVLVVGMIPTLLNTVRVGLLPRWLGFLGIFSAVLILLGGATLELIPAFWLVMVGVLISGRWPKDPPAWEAGEARPWPSGAEQRAARQGARGKPATAVAGNGAGAPAPAQPAAPSSRRRRRKGRGAG